MSTRRTLRRVMVGSAALLLAACATACGKDSGSSAGGFDAGAVLISNGTSTVLVDGKTVSFPGPVTDAAWSPDGSRVAFVDGDGNIATAKPDGSDLLVLTTTDSTVVRSRPSWSRAWIIYAEKPAAGGSPSLRTVPINGCGDDEEFSYDSGEVVRGQLRPSAPSAATGTRPSRVAFQHDNPLGPEIWINDTNMREPVTAKVAIGTEPALSLDGRTLAYVGADGEVFVKELPEYAWDVDTADGTAVTFGAQSPTHLELSPDGSEVAYSTPTGVEEVSTTPPGTSNEVTSLSGSPGVVSLLPGSPNTRIQLRGDDPIGLAVAASHARWPGVEQYTPGEQYDGAIGATITTPELAGEVATSWGPLLLTDADSIDPRVADELHRIFGTVGSGWGTPHLSVRGLSPAAEAALRDLGFELDPADSGPANSTGADLCDVQLFGQSIVVVDGSNALAVRLGATLVGPLLVVNGQLTSEQSSYLSHSSAAIEKVYFVGDVPGAVRSSITTLVAPLGHEDETNPTLPELHYGS